MRKFIRKRLSYFFIFILIFRIYYPFNNAYADTSSNNGYTNNIILLNYCDEDENGYPVYEEIESSDEFDDVYNNSFVKKSFELYNLAKKYSDVEDKNIYIAFRKNSGCSGEIGFYLKKDNKLYDKTNSPCIELGTNSLKGNYNKLDSITQILPHEMGHVIVDITTDVTDASDNAKSLDMHYSDIVTGHSTAFNEGFGVHFQVISRMYEENDDIKKGIYNDLNLQKVKTDKTMIKLDRDFKLPMRLDYYRVLSSFYQSKYESIKRDELSTTNNCIYKNKKCEFRSPEKTILYRNMGFSKDENEKRTFEQSISTESVVSNFFTNLIISDEGSLDSRYEKIFNVFSKYLKNNTDPNLIQFVNGYITEYPNLSTRVKEIFKNSTGYEFQNSCQNEIWCTAKDPHSKHIFDQFNGMKCPIYIFNLNTCEIEDLMKIKEISKTDAEKIIEYRDSIGGFKDNDDIKSINDVDENILNTLYDNTDIESINENINLFNDEDNMIKSITLQNIKHLLLRTLFWIFIVCILTSIYYFKVAKYSKKSVIKSILRVVIKFIFYMILGLICVYTQGSIILHNHTIGAIVVYLLIAFIIEAITLILKRYNKQKQINSIAEFIIITVIILYSLY